MVSLKDFLAGLDPHTIEEILERAGLELRTKIIPHVPLPA